MIQFDDVSLGFSDHTLFEGASFSLQDGERCGLVGRNGSGKSTIFRLITRQMEPDRGHISQSKNYRIGHLEQHIHFTEPTLIEETALALVEKDHLYKAERILFGLGFTEDDLYASPTSFSGGYQLRINLAKVLVAEPNCLLLDEPTNYLDLLAIRWLTGFLKKWPGEFILISHDREFMDQVTTHTMGIHREKVKKMRGSSIDFFEQILLEEEVHEKTRQKIEKKKEHLQSFIDRFGAKASKAGQAESKKKMLARVPVLERLNALSELSFSFNEAPFPGKKMVEANGLQFSYTEDQPLIDDFSLEIEKGERIAIIGKNGRGKSTLLRLLGGDLKPKGGEVSSSENVRLGYFGQTHIDRLHRDHTIEEELASANSALNYKDIKSISGKMMFSGDLSEKKIAFLSGGEKSRVLLGKIVAKPCNLLLLDEPTHHLDIESIEALIDAIEDFSGSVIIVTHSELILRRIALDKIILCGEAKQTLFLGNYDEFLDSVGWEDSTKSSPTKKKGSNDRKERADAINKRSAALKPIEQQIAATEKKLVSLEELQKAFLVDPKKEDAKASGLRQKEIEQLETELYDLYALLEETKRSFE